MRVHRTKKALTIVFAIFLFAIMLTGCSNKSKKLLIGTWQGLKLEYQGEAYTMEEVQSRSDKELNAELEFAKDGTWSGEILGKDFTGTYKVKGTNIHVETDAKEQARFKIDGEHLIVEDGEDGTITFAKQ